MTPPDAPIGRMTCMDCAPDGRCDGECLEKNEFPAWPFAIVVSAVVALAVIGAMTVLTWIL